MALKKLLGEKYTDEMTVEDIAKALGELDLVDRSTLPESISKKRFDEVASELSAANKKVRELETQMLTEEELRQRELDESLTKIQELQSEILHSRMSERLAKAGYGNLELDDVLLSNLSITDAEAADKIIDSLIQAMDATGESAAKKALADRMDKTPEPPAPEVDTPSFEKMSLTEQMELKSTNPEKYRQLSRVIMEE
ncbi:MAG: hypothetical protein WC965_13365 [Thiohalomonadaceae bacterium]